MFCVRFLPLNGTLAIVRDVWDVSFTRLYPKAKKPPKEQNIQSEQTANEAEVSAEAERRENYDHTMEYINEMLHGVHLIISKYIKATT